MWLLTLFLTNRIMRRTTKLWPIMSHFAIITLRSVHAQMQWKRLQTGRKINKIACVRSWGKELRSGRSWIYRLGYRKV
ncbi:hypothetical protein BC830DRAFT_1116140, partial [Chytriomyces sp. MP71]